MLQAFKQFLSDLAAGEKEQTASRPTTTVSRRPRC